MKKIIFAIAIVGILVSGINWAISNSTMSEREKRSQVDTRIDNNGYWKRMAKRGLATLNPEVEVPAAVYTGSNINSKMVRFENSPDVPVTTESSTQSENSIFVDPNNNLVAFNSNNSTPQSGGSVYGADYLYTFDFASTWAGSVQGPNGSNSGDPASCIGTDGRWYVGYISNPGGQDISYSDDQGQTWTNVIVAPVPGSGWNDLADKNHMWIDAKPGSPYENHLYNAWTDFGGPYDEDIVLSRSIDNGETWSPRVNISQDIATSGHCQGVNISTGPNGEVYAVWTIYDNWPNDENSIGMARSFDGGETWEPAFRIINNIKGIRNAGVPQNMRVNSFPVMAVDASDGPNSGNIYVVWTNVGVPGINTGSDRDIYLIKSTDNGDTWSDPIRVNQDPIGQGKAHYLPWISCDASTGILSVIFYDNRNTTPTQAEAWVAVSTNAGETWEDFKVSDVAFTPSPIPGLASGYFGDYLAIHSQDGKVYPCWTDNRTGYAMAYVSVFETIDVVAPFGLTASTNQETGECSLNWNFNGTTGFEQFNIYRNSELISSTNNLQFSEILTDYGYYTYSVTAVFSGDLESDASSAETQYGSSTIEITPASYIAIVSPEDSETQLMKIKNIGVLDLSYNLSPFFKAHVPEYEIASGGGDEFINIVKFANLENNSGNDFYADYTKLAANVSTGNTYEIQVVAGNYYIGDQCKVWIDWDQNGVFDESAIILSDSKTSGTFEGKITIPVGSKQGLTGMRIRLSDPGKLSAYGDTEYGEVEDYSIAIESWLTLNPTQGLIAPGDSLMVDVTFDASGIDVGSYYDIVSILSNDLDNPSTPVEFVMHVTDMSAEASADPGELCYGNSTQLMANASGGMGSYTYTWTSQPEGFTSNEANPIVEPSESTTYFVEVSDGVVTIPSSVLVVVNQLPAVDLGEDEVLCGINQIDLDAGNPGDTYLWSTGETAQSIVGTGSGETLFWAEVTNENGCKGYDSVYINFADVPVVELGADTSTCGGATITLNAGNPGSTYLWSNLETSQSIDVDTIGHGYGEQEFSVLVTNQAGCENTGNIMVEFVDCTSIDELLDIDIRAYPNPSQGIFTIDLNGQTNKPLELKVTSQSGKIVYQENDIIIDGNKKLMINLSQYSSGIYTISITNNGASATTRMVIR